MNKKERNMLYEIVSLTNAVPNFQNNMDMAAYSSFRNDSLQMQKFLYKLTNALLYMGVPEEDKKYWEEQFNETLKLAKEFLDFRKNEGWSNQSKYTYNI